MYVHGYECTWWDLCKAINWRMFFAFVGLQSVDLNMLTPVDDAPHPSHTLYVVAPPLPTSTKLR